MQTSRIRQLDQEVINRIAAGEVIQRPANALKEIIENSLDANPKSIDIFAVSGGIKALRVSDNGFGIHPDDFPLLCARHATSKLSSFEELPDVATFGFRGEALAAMSYAARLEVSSFRAGERMGAKASFENGHVVGEAVPCARAPGTTVILRDMFYAHPTRRDALAKPRAELTRLLRVFRAYAIHRPTVGFSFATGASLLGAAGTSPVRVRALPTALGGFAADERRQFAARASVLLEQRFAADELLFAQAPPFRATQGSAALPAGLLRKMRVTIVCSHPSAVEPLAKPLASFVFVNERLVQFPELEEAVHAALAAYLPPRARIPFLYAALSLDPRAVDINAHPAKERVIVMRHEAVATIAAETVEEALRQGGGARYAPVQSLLVPVSDVKDLPESPSVPQAESPVRVIREKELYLEPDITRFSQRVSAESPARAAPASVAVALTPFVRAPLGTEGVQALMHKLLLSESEGIRAATPRRTPLRAEALIGVAAKDTAPLAMVQSGENLLAAHPSSLAAAAFYAAALFVPTLSPPVLSFTPPVPLADVLAPAMGSDAPDLIEGAAVLLLSWASVLEQIGVYISARDVPVLEGLACLPLMRPPTQAGSGAIDEKIIPHRNVLSMCLFRIAADPPWPSQEMPPGPSREQLGPLIPPICTALGDMWSVALVDRDDGPELCWRSACQWRRYINRDTQSKCIVSLCTQARLIKAFGR
eukprot:gnl/Chilomastix_cuspidata/4477.p1 GENE.gnl/Chilomastix_cuspidata/4477~~gnl/Chilomastix_cuspidata/4477.p1  ORF type:complete len:746 (+),score=254.70 gnl/Chilomastix_cuspidata/4477:114-2240(+)